MLKVGDVVQIREIFGYDELRNRTMLIVEAGHDSGWWVRSMDESTFDNPIFITREDRREMYFMGWDYALIPNKFLTSAHNAIQEGETHGETEVQEG